MTDSILRISKQQVSGKSFLFSVRGDVACSSMHPRSPARILLLLDFSDSVNVRAPNARKWATALVKEVADKCRRSDKLVVGALGTPDLLGPSDSSVDDWSRQEAIVGLQEKIGEEGILGDVRERGSWLVPPLRACLDKFGALDYCLAVGDGLWFDRREAADLLGDIQLQHVGAREGWTPTEEGERPTLTVEQALHAIHRPRIARQCQPTALLDRDEFVDDSYLVERGLEPRYVAGDRDCWHIEATFIATEGYHASWDGLDLQCTHEEGTSELSIYVDGAARFLRSRREIGHLEWDLELARRIVLAQDGDHAETASCPHCEGTFRLAVPAALCPRCGKIPFCSKEQSRLQNAFFVVLDRDAPDPHSQEPLLIEGAEQSPPIDQGKWEVEYRGGDGGIWQLRRCHDGCIESLESPRCHRLLDGRYLLIRIRGGAAR